MKILSILERANKLLTKIEERVLILTGLFLVLLNLIAVINRYFLKYTMAWYEELSLILYYSLVYFGASNLARYDAHLKMSILSDNLKEGKAKISLNLFVELFCLFISIIGLYFGIKIALTTTMKTVVLGIPNSIILFLSLVPGFFGLTLVYLYRFIVSLNKFKNLKIKKGRL